MSGFLNNFHPIETEYQGLSEFNLFFTFLKSSKNQIQEFPQIEKKFIAKLNQNFQEFSIFSEKEENIILKAKRVNAFDDGLYFSADKIKKFLSFFFSTKCDVVLAVSLSLS